ncbi:DUF4870 domain-containing protein [Salinimicrobium sp. TH3]|uniref:DUF4870 domain-containing protein n=1 Tax=Salinimicrobium sp. TH3 TaxID=2997342 RepID=UPI0022728DEC|nr:DUF4870 domain-containing protein [Salinimicrobium sp. TH3]MCY2688702.1 DUF4870 domain-containing protein [Salinimicrobium sp. TH3]
MNNQSTNPDKTVAALIHLSTFSQFFFPFGNFIFPLIFWTAKKNDPFVNEHGKQALNFQISLFLYFIFLVMAGIAGAVIIGIKINFDGPLYINEHHQWIGNPMEASPIIIYVVIMALLILGLLVLNIYAVISATIRAGEGHLYKYPLTINFLNAKNIHNSSAATEKTEPQQDL